MASKRKAEAAPPPSDEELAAGVRSVLRERALTKAELGRKLPRGQAARALELARELVRQGVLFRFAKGATEVFFAEDPVTRLDRLVPDLLRQRGPLGSAPLKQAIKEAAPNHDGFFADWLKAALARNVVYERPGKPKTLVHEPPSPDLKLLLKRPLAELAKLLGGLDAKGVSRERIADFLRAELGVPDRGPATTPAAAVDPATTSRAGASSREVFLEALRRFAADNPKGALLPVRELRARAGLGKQDFDAAALALSREGLLVLHHHDHAGALSEADQNALVRDALGRHYIGVALRGSA
jgi:hypothetical protein